MRSTPLADRIWAKVDRRGGADACWPWTGATSLKRRGRRPNIQTGGRGSPHINPARWICEQRHGPPPDDGLLREAGHTCPEGENALCCNPAHLEWMTRTENERYKRFMEKDDAAA